MTDYNEMQSSVQTAVREGVFASDPQRIVTKALVIYESIREDGSRVLTVVPSEDMRAYDILGFVDYAQQVARSWIDMEMRDQ